MGIAIIPMFILFCVVHGVALAYSISALMKLRKNPLDFVFITVIAFLVGIPLALLSLKLSSEGDKIFAYIPAFVGLAYLPALTLPLGIITGLLQKRLKWPDWWALVSTGLLLAPVVTFPVLYFALDPLLEYLELTRYQ